MAEPDDTPDDDVDPDIPDDAPPDDDDGDKPDDDWKPPSKEEWEKLQRTARARKGEATKARAELAKLRKGAADGSLNGDAAKEAEERVKTAEVRVVRSEALAAIVGSDFNGSRDQAKAMLRLLDLDGVEADTFGDYDFEDKIEDLKELFPERFGKAKQPAGRASTGRGRADDTPTDDVDTRFAKRLLRQR
jgi:hypothetical protein